MGKNQTRPALSAFLLMLTMSLLTTALSFFVAPVCEDLGFGRGSFTLYYSLMVASGAVSASFLGTYMNSHGPRGVVVVSGIWIGLGLLGLSFSSQLWMFYVLGAAMGLLGSTCVYLAANVIVQQSYSSKNAAAILGIVMAGAGIGGVIWSNLIPKILDSFGWRFGYRVVAVLWVVIALVAALILGKQETAVAFGHAKTGSNNDSGKKAVLRSLRFFQSAALMCILTVCSCISQHLPAVLGEMGHDSTQIGVLVSVMTAASAVGTILEGMVCSKIGIKKTMVGILVVYAAGYCLMSLGAGTYTALIFLAIGSGSIGTLMPIVVRRIFGGLHYAAIWSVVITCSSVASFLASPTWGMVYDFTGSYRPALMTMPVLLALGMICLLGAFKNVED
jgi:MFS family permease